MVQCDSCDKWFHLECVGLDESAAQEITQYFCAECRSHGSLTKKVLFITLYVLYKDVTIVQARIEDLISESDQPSRSPNDSVNSGSPESPFSPRVRAQ